MGFGILFIGYVLTFLMKIIPYGYVFEIVGLLIMLYAFTKLSEYERTFKYPFFASFLLVALAIYNTCIMFGLSALDNIFYASFYPPIKTVCDAVFHALLFVAVARIAKDTEVNKIQTAAYRNMIIYGLYFVLQMLISVPFFAKGEAGKIVGMCGNILWLSWVVLDSIMIFSAYMNICDENDGDMSAKPSRFAFINKMREEFDKKESKARKADMEYIQKKAEKRKEKRRKK